MKTENLTQPRHEKLHEIASKKSKIDLLTPHLHYKDAESILTYLSEQTPNNRHTPNATKIPPLTNEPMVLKKWKWIFNKKI